MAQEIAFDPQDRQQMLGLGGSILLAFGVFAPLVSIPMIGHLNYFRNGQGDGVMVLILAGAGVGLSLFRIFKGVLGAGVGSLGLMVVTFVQFQVKMAAAHAEMQEKLAGNPFRGLAEAAMGSIQLEWGWGVLLLGAGLMVGSGLIGSHASRRRCPHCAELIQAAATMCHFCSRDVASVPQPPSNFAPVISDGPSETAECRHCHEMMWTGLYTCAACGGELRDGETLIEVPVPDRIKTFAVAADRVTASQRPAFLAIVKRIDPMRSDDDLLEALGRPDVRVAAGLTQNEANGLMLALHEAGISAQKHLDP